MGSIPHDQSWCPAKKNWLINISFYRTDSSGVLIQGELSKIWSFVYIYIYTYILYHQIISNNYCILSICGVHSITVFYNPWTKIDQPFLGYPPAAMASPRGGVAAASTRPFTLIESGSNHHTTTSPVGPNLWPVSNILMDKIRLQTLGFWDMSQVYGFGGVSIHGSVTMICGANASVHQDAGCHKKTHSGPYDKDPSYTWPYDPWPTTHLLLVASPTAKASPKSSRSKQCICHRQVKCLWQCNWVALTAAKCFLYNIIIYMYTV